MLLLVKRVGHAVMCHLVGCTSLVGLPVPILCVRISLKQIGFGSAIQRRNLCTCVRRRVSSYATPPSWVSNYAILTWFQAVSITAWCAVRRTCMRMIRCVKNSRSRLIGGLSCVGHHG